MYGPNNNLPLEEERTVVTLRDGQAAKVTETYRRTFRTPLPRLLRQ
jgi:hypothetical protein